MSASDEERDRDAFVPAESDDEELSAGCSLTDGEEDLETVVRAIRARAEARFRPAPVAHQPEAVDHFLRSFLLQMNMTETLECFQTEWHEMAQRGQLDTEQVGAVPDAHVENKRLHGELQSALREREEYRRAAAAAAGALLRVQKARDAHRLQHKRAVQERNRLIEETRRLKVKCDEYEPAVKRMSDKHQAVLKQTMLMSLEKDKRRVSPGEGGSERHPVIHPRPATPGKK